ncbi:MAG: GntR family transcriptional regulator [Myxococcaceae bacterium]
MKNAEAVEAELVAGILSGRFQEQAFLPSVRELSKEIGTSTNTVLRALSALRARGFVEGEPGGRLLLRSLVNTTRVDTLVELALHYPATEARTRAVHEHLVDYLRDQLAEAAELAARNRTPDHLDWLSRYFAELFEERHRAIVQFELAKVLVAAAGNLARSAVLNAYQQLFEAPAPLGPGDKVLFPIEGRDAFLDCLEGGDGEGARRWVRTEVAACFIHWRAGFSAG